LLEKGQIKLTGNHKIPSVEELKNRRYCKYHNSNTHNTMIAKFLEISSSKLLTKEILGKKKLKVVWV
jgi:hypothetical protein